MYEDGLCSCGQPAILAHHPVNNGWYEAEKVQCNSCAARESSTAGTSAAPYQPQPGEKVFTRYTRPPNKPMQADIDRFGL